MEGLDRVAQLTLRDRTEDSSAWKRGPSGNSGGRPKIAAEIRSFAHDHGAHAIERFVVLMHSKNESVGSCKQKRFWIEDMAAQGMEISGQQDRSVPPVIHVEFVTPRTRGEPYSIP